jgi:hypothetical protein
LFHIFSLVENFKKLSSEIENFLTPHAVDQLAVGQNEGNEEEPQQLVDELGVEEGDASENEVVIDKEEEEKINDRIVASPKSKSNSRGR